MDDLIKKIIERMQDFDDDVKDDAARLRKMETAWANGRDVYEHKRQTGTGIKEIAKKCGLVATTLQRFVRFYRFYPNGYFESIQGKPLMWGHFMAVLYLRDPKQRQWYLEQAAFSGWSTQEIRRRVSNHFYESAVENLVSGDQGGGESGELRQIDQNLYTYSAKVLKVIDADTLKVEVDVGFSMRYETKLRLRGINAPERKTPLGIKAKKFVEQELAGCVFGAQEHRDTGTQEKDHMHMCSGALVILRSYKSGKYGRFIADVWYLKGETATEEILRNGKLLNQVLLDQGLAEKIE